MTAVMMIHLHLDLSFLFNRLSMMPQNNEMKCNTTDQNIRSARLLSADRYEIVVMVLSNASIIAWKTQPNGKKEREKVLNISWRLFIWLVVGGRWAMCVRYVQFHETHTSLPFVPSYLLWRITFHFIRLHVLWACHCSKCIAEDCHHLCAHTIRSTWTADWWCEDARKKQNQIIYVYICIYSTWFSSHIWVVRCCSFSSARSLLRGKVFMTFFFFLRYASITSSIFHNDKNEERKGKKNTNKAEAGRVVVYGLM